MDGLPTKVSKDNHHIKLKDFGFSLNIGPKDELKEGYDITYQLGDIDGNDIILQSAAFIKLLKAKKPQKNSNLPWDF